MRNWLVEKLKSRIQGDTILLKWYVDETGTPSFVTVQVDDMLNALYGQYDDTGKLIDVNIPEGSYENLTEGDRDNAKGYKPIFEQWHKEGLL